MSMTSPVDTRQAEAPIRVNPRMSLPATLIGFGRSNPLGGAGVVILFVVILVALLAPVIAPYNPQQVGVAPNYSPPGRDLVQGSDQLGRDVLSRLIYGARISMYVGLLSVGIGITLGTLMGIFSAYMGGVVDLVVQRLIDALMGFPPLSWSWGSWQPWALQ